jgi:hypothetical protein
VTVEPPRNLDELRAVKAPADRAVAARAYVEQRQEAIRQALAVRDAAIRELLENSGPSEVARLCDVSLSTVKLARGRTA